MMSIGNFARLGGVSVRMLRHYDQIGLLPPAQTGHRSYDLRQLPTLNRIVALKGLGFTLEQVSDLLRDGVEPGEMQGMLRLRRSQLARQLYQQRHTLDRVAARLSLIERETAMSSPVQVKHVPAQRLASLSATAPDPSRQSVGPLVPGLFDRVADLMDRAGGDRTAPVARYAPAPEGGAAVVITAGYVLPGGPVPGLDLQELPAAEVATVVHQGSMGGIAGAYQDLARWAETRGHAASLEAGCWREVYLEANGEDQSEWIVEVQLELAPAQAGKGATGRSENEG